MTAPTRALAPLGVLAANLDRNLRDSICDLVTGDRIALSLRPEATATDPEHVITISIDARSMDAMTLIGRLRSAYNVAARHANRPNWTESLIMFVPPHLRRPDHDLPVLFTVRVLLAN